MCVTVVATHVIECTPSTHPPHTAYPNQHTFLRAQHLETPVTIGLQRCCCCAAASTLTHRKPHPVPGTTACVLCTYMPGQNTQPKAHQQGTAKPPVCGTALSPEVETRTALTTLALSLTKPATAHTPHDTQRRKQHDSPATPMLLQTTARCTRHSDAITRTQQLGGCGCRPAHEAAVQG